MLGQMPALEAELLITTPHWLMEHTQIPQTCHFHRCSRALVEAIRKEQPVCLSNTEMRNLQLCMSDRYYNGYKILQLASTLFAPRQSWKLMQKVAARTISSKDFIKCLTAQKVRFSESYGSPHGHEASQGQLFGTAAGTPLVRHTSMQEYLGYGYDCSAFQLLANAHPGK